MLLLCAEHVNYTYKEAYRERVFRVMLSVPRATESALRILVDKALSQGGDLEDEVVLKLIWDHFSGSRALCREMPEFVIRVVEQRLRLEAALPPPRSDTEICQGLGTWKRSSDLGTLKTMDCYPASAWQGPFLNLLTYHPERGIDLVLRFINRCCAAYANAGGNIIATDPNSPHLRRRLDCP